MAVNHDAIGHDKHLAKEEVVFALCVKPGELVREPADGISLTRTGAVLYEIVARGFVALDVLCHTCDGPKLLEARKYGLLILLLVRLTVARVVDEVVDQ